MKTEEIVKVVGDLILDDGATIEQQCGLQALTIARGIESVLIPHIAENPTYAPLWQRFRAAPQEQTPVLAGILQVLPATDAALEQRLDTLMTQYRQTAAAARTTTFQTGGGAFVSGDVQTG